jgi:predicted acyl esterase
MRWVNAAFCETVVEGLAASIESYVTGEADAFGYWEERNNKPGVEKRYRGSILVVGGFEDHNVTVGQAVPWVNKLRRKGTYVKMMLGQWQHSFPDSEGNPDGTLRWDYADVLLRWWDRWLKEDEDVSLGPRVEVQDTSGRWRVEDSWPPEAHMRELFLTPGDGLLTSAASEEASATLAPSPRSRYVFISGPPAEQSELPSDGYCVLCAVFATPPQGRDLRIAGIPSLDLTVVPHGPGGNVAAYIYRVNESDVYDLVGYGNVDLRFPTGGHEAHPVTPGDEMRIEFNLEPLDTLIPKGQRLVLVLDQGNTNDMPGPPAFPVDLIYGGKRSSFTFPTVTPDPNSYFAPPPEP